jgi:hypothetical protein
VRNAEGQVSTLEAGLDPNQVYFARSWTSDAEYSALPDSAVAGVLDEARQLYTLRQVVDASIKSRLNAGIFFAPDSMSFGPIDDTLPPQPETDDLDAFTETLLEHMATPVDDPSSAASLVPLVMRGNADDGDKIKLIDVGRNVGEWAIELRNELVEALARGLDVDPSQLEGKGELNHWTGYSVDAEFNAKHVIPEGEAFAEFVSTAYLRPMLVKWEQVNPAEANRFVVEFDASNITARADKGVTALGLLDRALISPDAAIEANGFDDSDMPTDEQRRERFLVDLLKTNPELMKDYAKFVPWLAPLASAGGTTANSPSAVGPVAPPTQGSPARVVTPRNPESGGGEPPLPTTEGLPSAATVGLHDRVATAAHFAVLRALEVAGSRVLSKAAKDPALKARLGRRPKVELLGSMTTGDFKAVGLEPTALLAGAWDQLAREVEAWMVLAGFDRAQAALATAELTTNLTDIAEAGALGRQPNGLVVPDELIRHVLGVDRHAVRR